MSHDNDGAIDGEAGSERMELQDSKEEKELDTDEDVSTDELLVADDLVVADSLAQQYAESYQPFESIAEDYAELASAILESTRFAASFRNSVEPFLASTIQSSMGPAIQAAIDAQEHQMRTVASVISSMPTGQVQSLDGFSGMNSAIEEAARSMDLMSSYTFPRIPPGVLGFSKLSRELEASSAMLAAGSVIRTEQALAGVDTDLLMESGTHVDEPTPREEHHQEPDEEPSFQTAEVDESRSLDFVDARSIISNAMTGPGTEIAATTGIFFVMCYMDPSETIIPGYLPIAYVLSQILASGMAIVEPNESELRN